jgi:hypothetical protein
VTSTTGNLFGEKGEHSFAGDGVEGTGWLVSKDELAITDDGPSNRDPLLLATGYVVGETVNEFGDTRFTEGLAGHGAGLASVRAVEFKRQHDVLDDAERRHQVQLLEDEPDFRATHVGQFANRHGRQVGAVNQYVAGGWRVEPTGQVEQRRLAAARRAHDGDELAGLDGERCISQRKYEVVTVLELAFDGSEFEHGVHERLPFCDIF